MTAGVTAARTPNLMATLSKHAKQSCVPPKSAAVYAACLAPSVSPGTLSPRGSKKAGRLPELNATLLAPDAAKPETAARELDELWSFVLKRARKRWVWVAPCRHTRQV